MSYWDDVHHHQDPDRMWMGHPLVRAHINRDISGDPARWPMDWFSSAFRERLPLQRVASIGCGIGTLERDLVRRGIADHVVGIDATAQPIETARAAAEAEGLSSRIEYQVRDARAFLQAARVDGIFFHASLHHFDRMDEMMALCRAALNPGGLLYLDEFVGPSMREWSSLRLAIPNFAYYLMPRPIRRVGLIRSPVNPHDPTEAVCASEIMPAVQRHFQILEKRDYGGNLVSLIYPNLRLPVDVPDGNYNYRALERGLRLLLRLEDLLLRFAKSFHSVIVAERVSS